MAAFSSKTAYRALFEGPVVLAGLANIWNPYAPLAYKFHAWLPLRSRCWTVDRLARHGLASHVTCPLYDNEGETLYHISPLCPYALRVWTRVTVGARVHLPLPSAGIGDWWPQAVRALPANQRKDSNSMIILVLRALWLERNARVFDVKETSS
ncbi:uncharacterized protein [Lolium perenne]|uniref:uncharacterized protein n=1 Tax=Lolium perenne TaxID=4522 RepID=UPI003A98E6EE